MSSSLAPRNHIEGKQGRMDETAQLANLQIAEQALRRNLHVHSIGENAQAHMNRALAHIREAIIATDAGNGRSVDQLVRDLDGMERLLKWLQP